MTIDPTPSTRPRLWIWVGIAVTVVGIAVLWPLREVGQVCIMIYPAPPGCGAEEPRWVPLVGIGLLIALLAAQVVLFATQPRPRTALIVLAAAMVVVILAAVAVVALSQTGIWDAPQPPVIIE